MHIYLAVASEVGLQTNDTLLAEVLGEHVTRTATNTLWVGHFVPIFLSEIYDMRLLSNRVFSCSGKSLGDKNTDTTGGLDLLFGLAGEKTSLDNDWLSWETALAENLK